MDVLFLENFNNKSGGEQRHKERPTFQANFTGSKKKRTKLAKQLALNSP